MPRAHSLFTPIAVRRRQLKPDLFLRSLPKPGEAAADRTPTLPQAMLRGGCALTTSRIFECPCRRAAAACKQIPTTTTPSFRPTVGSPTRYTRRLSGLQAAQRTSDEALRRPPRRAGAHAAPSQIPERVHLEGATRAGRRVNPLARPGVGEARALSRGSTGRLENLDGRQPTPSIQFWSSPISTSGWTIWRQPGHRRPRLEVLARSDCGPVATSVVCSPHLRKKRT